jgi:hypothetical protein
MGSVDATKLIRDYELNTRLIQQFSEDITDEEGVLQMGFEANSFNWVLGHILSRRSSALDLLGQGTLWPDQVDSLYCTGSQPIREVLKGLSMEELRQYMQHSIRCLRDGLTTASQAFLEEEVVTDRGKKPRGEHIQGLHWHETYHIGQLEMLRGLIDAHRQAHAEIEDWEV